MATAFNITNFTEKIKHPDKDFRFMALSDLNNELQKENFKLEGDNEKKICDLILGVLLTDSSGDVQGLAVKCLGPLVKKIHQNQIESIVEKIADKLLSKDAKAETKDITSLALKTVITEIQTKDGPLLIRKLTSPVVTFLKADGTEKLEALDLLNDLASRFGHLLKDHDAIQDAVLPQLSSTRTAVRKKTIQCLGHLSVTIPDKLFNALVEHLIQNAQKSQKADQIKTCIQAIGAVSRAVGYRLGKWMSQVIPIIVQYCNDDRFKEDDDLRENCFQTFESLILRSPKEITPFLKKITEQALTFVKYDPNYGEEDDQMETEEEEQDEEEDLDGNDDDESWKVRRSSAKTLAAIISTRPELLGELYQTVAPAVIARFREREENVKLDIFITFQSLLKQTSTIHRRLPQGSESSPVGLLRKIVPNLIKAIKPQLTKKSLKVRIGVLALLRDLVAVDNGLLTEHISVLVPGTIVSLKDKSNNPNLLIEALTFLRLLLSSHPPQAFFPHIDSLLPAVLALVNDTFYKITAEALRVATELVRTIRAEGTDFNFKPYVKSLFTATFTKLKALDADQEVKESAITCAGLIIANLGDELKAETPECLKILVERLSNEITRVVSIKALATIASSPLKIDLNPILTETVNQLSAFLRQNNRQLKQSSLITLTVIVKHHGTNKAVYSLFSSVLTQLAPLVSDSDLHLSHLALSLTSNILRVNSDSASQVKESVYTNILALVSSSLLQGLALESLLTLYGQLVTINAKNFGFDFLLDSLLNQVKSNPKLPKQSYSSIAQCIAAITANGTQAQRDAVVTRFIADIKKSKDASANYLALLSLGEIGRRVDLGSHSDAHSVILGVFDSTSEEAALSNAASFALGNLAVGNLSKFVPFILKDLQDHPNREYLLLHSLRELISRHSTSPDKVKDFNAQLPSILPLLYQHCQNKEEGTRNVVAECLGKLTLTYSDQLTPKLLELSRSQNVATRGTAINALKFTIVEQPHPIDQTLQTTLTEFVPLLQDPDLTVRRSAILTFNYAAHNKAVLLQPILPKILPLVYGETKVRTELIREVEMGPFKHKVDDGLDLRKAAFECMYTLLESCFEKLDVPQFLQHLNDGLKDVYDIKMLSHLMLAKLAHFAPAAIIESLDALIEPLKATITTKPKDSAVKQEFDSNEELVRSALRAIHAISKIPNVEQNYKWEEFFKVVTTGELGQKFESIRRDSPDL